MIIETLQTLATVIIGIYAGSLLTEGTILVPYWRRMDPSDFFRLHGTLGPSLFKYFAPLTSAAVGLSVLAAIFGNPWNIFASGLCLTALAIFFAYFKRANASFAVHDLSNSKLAIELSHWANWHWLRTIIVVGAFLASIIGQS